MLFEDFDPTDGEENDETEEELDIDESTEVKDEADFLEKYGFEHECHCAEDWASGNLGVVAVCYLNMCRDSLEVLAKTLQEKKEAQAELAALKLERADEQAS